MDILPRLRKVTKGVSATYGGCDESALQCFKLSRYIDKKPAKSIIIR